MNKQTALTLVKAYTSAWENLSKDEILNCLTEDAVIVEAHGLKHQDKENISVWLDGWLATGSTLPYWNIESFFFDSEQQTAFFTWEFESMYERQREVSRGSSIVQFKDNKIQQIKGFQETKPS